MPQEANDTTPDFIIERKNKKGELAFVLYTPATYRAYDWARKHLNGAVQWGRSYVLTEKRAKGLRGHLAHKEGFVLA